MNADVGSRFPFSVITLCDMKSMKVSEDITTLVLRQDRGCDFLYRALVSEPFRKGPYMKKRIGPPWLLVYDGKRIARQEHGMMIFYSP